MTNTIWVNGSLDIPNLEVFNEGSKQALQVSNLAVLYSYSTNWANLDDVQLNQSYWSQ